MKYLLPCAVLLSACPTRANDVEATAPRALDRPLRLALGSTSAFGVTHGRFFNQLVGPRLDYRFTPRFAFGAALAYVNLKGKDGRVHNLLPEASLEYRVALRGEKLGAPLRFSPGYLPRNGPTLRVGAGLDFSFGPVWSVDFSPLELMVWVTRERPELSLNGSLSVRATP